MTRRSFIQSVAAELATLALPWHGFRKSERVPECTYVSICEGVMHSDSSATFHAYARPIEDDAFGRFVRNSANDEWTRWPDDEALSNGASFRIVASGITRISPFQKQVTNFPSCLPQVIWEPMPNDQSQG